VKTQLHCAHIDRVRQQAFGKALLRIKKAAKKTGCTKNIFRNADCKCLIYKRFIRKRCASVQAFCTSQFPSKCVLDGRCSIHQRKNIENKVELLTPQMLAWLMRDVSQIVLIFEGEIS